MPISNLNRIERDIAMLVRKDCVTFASGDRLRIDAGVRTPSGGPVPYYVGEVYYDFDRGRHFYRLYNGDGLLVVPSNGPREIGRDLAPAQQEALVEKVRRYAERSVFRARNIKALGEALDACQGEHILFSAEGGFPAVQVDRHREGVFCDVSVEGVFRHDGEIYLVAGSPVDGESFNYPLCEVSDMGVGNVLSCVMRNDPSLQHHVDVPSETRQPRKDRGRSMTL